MYHVHWICHTCHKSSVSTLNENCGFSHEQNCGRKNKQFNCLCNNSFSHQNYFVSGENIYIGIGQLGRTEIQIIVATTWMKTCVKHTFIAHYLHKLKKKRDLKFVISFLKNLIRHSSHTQFKLPSTVWQSHPASWPPLWFSSHTHCDHTGALPPGAGLTSTASHSGLRGGWAVGVDPGGRGSAWWWQVCVVCRDNYR